MTDQTLSLSRRKFIQASLAAATSAGIAVPGMARADDAGGAKSWSNWSGGQTATPKAIPHPKAEAEIVSLVKNGPYPIRAVGAGHSFAPLVPSDGSIVCLKDMSGVISADPETGRAHVYAGTSIRDLGEPLWDAGLSLPNQGDVDPQSMAGAVGTSTHGTGVTLPSLSSVPTAIKLVTGSGTALTCSGTTDRDIFTAARCAMGTLGIMTEMELQCVPRYGLKGKQWLEPLKDVLAKINTWKAEHRHFEFWLFPYSEYAMVKMLDPTDEVPEVQTEKEEDWPSEDTLLKWAVELVRIAPFMNGVLQDNLDALIDPTEYYGPAFQVFPSPRDVRFNEMEYQVPADQGPEALLAVQKAIQDADIPLAFPIEYRYVKADNAWLSPFYGRDSASISVHQYHKQDYRPLFATVEPVFDGFEGRPHWGKLHTKTGPELAALYPRFEDFARIRRELDPKGVFLNAHMAAIFEGVS